MLLFSGNASTADHARGAHVSLPDTGSINFVYSADASFAACGDAHRASLVGDSKEHANADILDLLTIHKSTDRFLLPIAEMSRINGASLAAGIQVDVAVPGEDEDALMDAARALFGGSSH